MGNWADAPTQNRCWKEPASPSRRHAGLPRTMRVRRRGGTGRRAGLKIRCPKGRVSYAGEPMVPPRAPSFATRCAHAQASARQERGLAEPTKRQLCSYHGARAEVAELADAPDSKSGARKGVWVRFPPSALIGQRDRGLDRLLDRRRAPDFVTAVRTGSSVEPLFEPVGVVAEAFSGEVDVPP